MRQNPFAMRLIIRAALIIAISFLFYQVANEKLVPYVKTFFKSKESASAMHIIRIADIDVSVSIANTQETRERGLGGRAGLGAHEGMLFVFPNDDYYAFWMKDMRFSIDIVWISATGTIVFIAPNVSPKTYPRSFRSPVPARYVLELPEGFVETYHLKKGDTVQL